MEGENKISLTNPIFICVALAVLSMMFILYGHRNREVVQLTLKKDFAKLPATTVDWWTVSHLVLYAVFGFLIPNYHTTFFFIGVAFEVIEDMLSSDENTQLVKCDRDKKRHIMCRFSQNDDYWYGKWDDVFFNLLGYTIGSSIRTSFMK